jgi:predicted MFS family arabinose efflux permease
MALAVAGFIAIITETLPACLLPQISTDLSVSKAFAGQFITAYALG